MTRDEMKASCVNYHLLKRQPLWHDGRGHVVKLLNVYKTNDGLCFTTEIMQGESKGKWSQAIKSRLKRYKGDV